MKLCLHRGRPFAAQGSATYCVTARTWTAKSKYTLSAAMMNRVQVLPRWTEVGVDTPTKIRGYSSDITAPGRPEDSFSLA